MMTFNNGTKVVVHDPDGHRWLGIVIVPSPLWARWYVVKPQKKGGKASNYHVHETEMKNPPKGT